MSVEPTVEPLAAYRPLARVPPHRGTASFTLGDEALSGPAEFLLPPGGQAVVAFRAPADLTSQDFGRELVIVGNTEAGPFRLECAQIYVRKASRFDNGSSWSVISPINGPVRITYGMRAPIGRALVLLNNFDFSCGDAVTDGRGWTRINTPLGVDGGGRRIIFRQRTDRPQLLALVSAGLLHSTSLVEIAFDAQARPDRESAHALAA